MRHRHPRQAAALILWLIAPSGERIPGPRSHHGGSAPSPSPLAPVLRAVGVGREPVAIAVDARAGRAFVLGRAGEVSVLDAATGTVVRTVAVGRGTRTVAVDEATGRAFATDPGRVFMLDARSGAVLRALPLPVGDGDPASIAVLDATTGRLKRGIAQYVDPLAVNGAARRIVLPYACGDTPCVRPTAAPHTATRPATGRSPREGACAHDTTITRPTCRRDAHRYRCRPHFWTVGDRWGRQWFCPGACVGVADADPCVRAH